MNILKLAGVNCPGFPHVAGVPCEHCEANHGKAAKVTPLTDRQIADFEFYRDHCRGCGAEFDTKWRLCPEECSALNP